MSSLYDIKVGFIGFGNMGSAIAEGFIHSNTLKSEQIFACAGNYDKLCSRTAESGINPCKTPLDVVENSDVIFIAVKPYLVDEIVSPLADALKGKTVISVAVNVDCSHYEKIIPGVSHLSTLPNTPVSIGEGIFICENKNTLSAEEKELADNLLSTISMVRWVDSSHFGIAGTISGCGPAFASLFIEALGDAAVKYGLPRKLSYELAGQMIAGTGKLLVERGAHPGEMKDAVCSPGGTTIVGVTTLEAEGFRNSVIKAIDSIQNK